MKKFYDWKSFRKDKSESKINRGEDVFLLPFYSDEQKQKIFIPAWENSEGETLFGKKVYKVSISVFDEPYEIETDVLNHGGQSIDSVIAIDRCKFLGIFSDYLCQAHFRGGEYVGGNIEVGGGSCYLKNVHEFKDIITIHYNLKAYRDFKRLFHEPALPEKVIERIKPIV
jgi:hypothetical protein